MTVDTWRVTVTSDDESHPEGGALLHGSFLGSLSMLREFATAMKPWGLVIASPMEQESDEQEEA